jgi:histidyl-tRNA synthetase
MKLLYKALRGTRDILPDEMSRWHFLEETTRRVFKRYQFSEIRTPLIEPTELFARSVGASSDIVRKEMYTFERSDSSISLRPENTAGVVRAVIEHALHRDVATGYPERYYYMGPMFRYERPQKGRQRQFHQIGVEVIGSSEPLADAETLQMLELYLDELGIAERELLIGTVGDDQCRPAYRKRLQDWLEPRLSQLCEDCGRRYSENPLRVFDCKIEQDRELLRGAPTMSESLCNGCQQHFEQVCRFLDEFGVAYRIDDRLVRGLDYYQRTVFEVVSGKLGAQDAILGGGRYDRLMAELGGPDIPGFGFAIGMERLILLLPKDRLIASRVDLALIALGDDGFAAAIGMAQRFRQAGVVTSLPLVERKLGAQMKRATRNGARYALFVGADEVAAGRYGLKDLETGDQDTLDEQQILARVVGENYTGSDPSQ